MTGTGKEDELCARDPRFELERCGQIGLVPFTTQDKRLAADVPQGLAEIQIHHGMAKADHGLPAQWHGFERSAGQYAQNHVLDYQ